jgi:hypothetical protein
MATTPSLRVLLSALSAEGRRGHHCSKVAREIPYALLDLEAMWIPGCLVYAGKGWSKGVLHTLEGSRRAVYCLPERPDLERTNATREIDHVLAAVFGLWEHVIPEARRVGHEPQLSLPLKGPKKAEARAEARMKKIAEDDGE